MPDCPIVLSTSHVFEGCKVLVDVNFRPWLLEFNRAPQLAAIPGNSEVTASREAVLDDMLSAVLDGGLPSSEMWAPLQGS